MGFFDAEQTQKLLEIVLNITSPHQNDGDCLKKNLLRLVMLVSLFRLCEISGVEKLLRPDYEVKKI